MISLPLLLAAALGAASPDAGSAAQAPRPVITIIPATLVARVLGQPGLAILDVNPPEEYAKHHLPGARNVGADDLAAALPADRAAEVVLYCTGPDCGVAEAMAQEAARLGYTQLFVMEDGILGWVAAGMPVATGGPPRPGPDDAADAGARPGAAPSAPGQPHGKSVRDH